ncbi:MAG: glycosyltransferase family 4 protein [Actinomycetota bacterium]|nr:glycosyltransferase family 4 protein [Actinomycetota bacterium]
MVFVTTTPALHKSGAFRLLGRGMDVLFLFFSRGREPYRSASATPVYEGLRHQDVGATAQSRAAVLKSLLRVVALSRYEVLIKCINGKGELLICYCACRLRRRKFILWTGIWKWPDSIGHRLGRPVVRYICRHADAVCTYGSHVSRFLEDEGVDSEKLIVVPQPVEPDRTFHRAGRRPVESSDRLRLLFVGRLVEEKGVATLLRAAGPLSDRVSLTVVGDGPQRGMLEGLAHRVGLDVTWVGQQDPSDLAELYRRSDSVVIPSVTTRMTREPWGFIANEAMLSGCVVVASTAVGAVAGGLVRDGVTGLVFEEYDHVALRDRLERLCMDQELRASLSRAGELEARTYTEERACAGFRAAIESVLRPTPDRSTVSSIST